MPDLAYYQVLSDDFSFTLTAFDPSSSHELTFNPTNDIVLDGPGSSRPVLFYELDPSNDVNNFRLDIFVRGPSGATTKIRSWNLDSTTSRSGREPFHHDLIGKGNNKIIFKTFKSDSSAGSVTVRNVMVFYHRNV